MQNTPSENPACPNCGAALDNSARRKTKCPACGTRIYSSTRLSNKTQGLSHAQTSENIDNIAAYQRNNFPM